MKSSTNFKSFAIIAVLTLFLFSCSNQRYSYIQKVNVKSKETARNENKAPVAKENLYALNQETSLITEPKVSIERFKTIIPEKTSQINESPKKEENILSNFISKRIQHKISSSSNVANVSPYLKGQHNNKTQEDELLYVLCIILCIVFLGGIISVGLATDWDEHEMLITLLLYLLFYIPGVIYSIIKVTENKDKF